MHRILCRIRVVTALLVVVACSKGETPRADSAAATPQRLAAVPAAAKAFPGALTKPIDAYTGDELYDFVKKLSYGGGHERQRNCKNDQGCGGARPTKHTTVQVDAVVTQDSIAASNVPQYGVVYIRALNKGAAEEARYGMLPGNKFEYYVIITRDSANAMQWSLEQLDTTPNARRHSQIGSGVFQGCNHAWTAGARADFKTCANAAAARDSVVTIGSRGGFGRLSMGVGVSNNATFTVRMGLALQGGGDDPMWAACAMGCCIIE